MQTLLLFSEAAGFFVCIISGVEWGLREGQELSLLNPCPPLLRPPQGISVLVFLNLIFTIAPLKETLRHFFPYSPLYEVLILQIYFMCCVHT